MTTNKHTPGDWTITQPKHTGRPIEVIVRAPAGFVARAIGATFEEAMANARLIAAAPELLAFVEWFAAKDHEERGRMLLKCMGWDPKNAEGPHDFAKRYAQAAIAKAEGRA